MKSEACHLQPGDAYQSRPGYLHTSLPCEGGTLRIGVFQDGTGNQMTDPDRYSNVAKLARVYRIDTEARATRWVYARGVGTNPDLTRDLLGQAIGTGAPQRLNGLLHGIQQCIADYEKHNAAYPTRIVLDGFGFSRGAAMIRHFVNVIKQGHFTLDGPFQSIPKEAFKIGFLGVFDSVGSFSLPGNNKDRGYTFHVPLHWLEDGGLHLVADDEHRANFDLQAMLQSDPHPQDRSDGTFQEIVLPGAHSDIGGGYPSTKSQGQSNNQLARIALQMMYNMARERGVPIDITATKDSARERDELWKIDRELQSEFDRLFAYYNDQGLRSAHRRWRVLQVAEEMAQRDLAQPNPGKSDQQARQQEREQKSLQEIRRKLKHTEKEIRSCFSALYEYDAFMGHAHKFYEVYAGWAHKSYNPHNTTPGMQAERKGKYREHCHREVFHNGYIAITQDKQFKWLAPRPFKDGAWVDEDCLKEFQV